MKQFCIKIPVCIIAVICCLYFINKNKSIFAYQYIYDYSEISKYKRAEYLAEYELFNMQQNNSSAKDLFWNYLKKDITGYESKQCDDECLLRNHGLQKNIWTVTFDLNQDGIPEIIGANDSVCCGSTIYCFNILQRNKFKKSYKSISYILFNREFYKIRVLKNKTNNFYDLYLFSTCKNGDRILRYSKIEN